MGTIGILNVGAGDTKLTFDKNNPAETIRAGRVVKDMLRRGYALLVEVDDGDKKKMQRVHAFDENTCEYIIADLDPIAAEKADEEEREQSESEGEAAAAPAKGPRKTTRRGTRSISAHGTSGVAVARTAGG